MYVNILLQARKSPNITERNVEAWGLLVFTLTEERWLRVAISENCYCYYDKLLGSTSKDKKEVLFISSSVTLSEKSLASLFS